MKITAAVVRDAGGQFLLEELDLEEPKADEVLVRIVATGICHTDLIVRDQFYPTPLPVVLGHEGAGIVEAVGPGVKAIRPGDRVLLSFGACGSCPSCRGGHVAYCWHHMEMNFSGKRYSGSAWDVPAPLSRTTTDGRGAISCEPVNGAFFQQSSFATHAIANEANAVVVEADAPLATLAPLGCGFQTGAGAVLNNLRPRAGASIAVMGAGSVGLAAVMAAVLAGCGTIVAVDRRKDRLDLARSLGATHAVDADEADVGAAVMEASRGGVEFSLDTTGNPGVLRTAVDVLQTRGVCGLIGGARLGTEASFEMTHLLFGRTVRGILQGDSDRKTFIPRLVSLFREGLFPIDRLVSVFPFAEIDRAVAAMKAGDVIKPVLDIAGAGAG